MGIKGLWKEVQPVCRPAHISQFRGQRVGVDAYCWLHRAVLASTMPLSTDKPDDKFIALFISRVELLQRYGVTPVIIFDGASMPMKAATDDARHQRREAAKQEGLKLLQQGHAEEAYKQLGKAIDVTTEIAYAVLLALKDRDVECIVAPYEADAQLAHLCREGYVQAVVSEDSDLMVYKCNILLAKMDGGGNCDAVHIRDIPKCSGFASQKSHEAFVTSCILAGCDYVASLPSIGIKTAQKLVSASKSIPELLATLQNQHGFTPRELGPYEEALHKALYCFTHHLVYCPNLKKVIPFHPLPPNVPIQTHLIGEIWDETIARAVCEQHTHDPCTHLPYTGKHKDSVQLYMRVTKRGQRSLNDFAAFERYKANRIVMRNGDAEGDGNSSNGWLSGSTALKAPPPSSSSPSLLSVVAAGGGGGGHTAKTNDGDGSVSSSTVTIPFAGFENGHHRHLHQQQHAGASCAVAAPVLLLAKSKYFGEGAKSVQVRSNTTMRGGEGQGEEEGVVEGGSGIDLLREGAGSFLSSSMPSPAISMPDRQGVVGGQKNNISSTFRLADLVTDHATAKRNAANNFLAELEASTGDSDADDDDFTTTDVVDSIEVIDFQSNNNNNKVDNSTRSKGQGNRDPNPNPNAEEEEEGCLQRSPSSSLSSPLQSPLTMNENELLGVASSDSLDAEDDNNNDNDDVRDDDVDDEEGTVVGGGDLKSTAHNQSSGKGRGLNSLGLKGVASCIMKTTASFVLNNGTNDNVGRTPSSSSVGMGVLTPTFLPPPPLPFPPQSSASVGVVYHSTTSPTETSSFSSPSESSSQLNNNNNHHKQQRVLQRDGSPTTTPPPIVPPIAPTKCPHKNPHCSVAHSVFFRCYKTATPAPAPPSTNAHLATTVSGAANANPSSSPHSDDDAPCNGTTVGNNTVHVQQEEGSVQGGGPTAAVDADVVVDVVELTNKRVVVSSAVVGGSDPASSTSKSSLSVSRLLLGHTYTNNNNGVSSSAPHLRNKPFPTNSASSSTTLGSLLAAVADEPTPVRGSGGGGATTTAAGVTNAAARKGGGGGGGGLYESSGNKATDNNNSNSDRDLTFNNITNGRYYYSDDDDTDTRKASEAEEKVEEEDKAGEEGPEAERSLFGVGGHGTDDTLAVQGKRPRAYDNEYEHVRLDQNKGNAEGKSEGGLGEIKATNGVAVGNSTTATNGTWSNSSNRDGYALRCDEAPLRDGERGGRRTEGGQHALPEERAVSPFSDKGTTNRNGELSSSSPTESQHGGGGEGKGVLSLSLVSSSTTPSCGGAGAVGGVGSGVTSGRVGGTSTSIVHALAQQWRTQQLHRRSAPPSSSPLSSASPAVVNDDGLSQVPNGSSFGLRGVAAAIARVNAAATSIRDETTNNIKNKAYMCILSSSEDEASNLSVRSVTAGMPKQSAGASTCTSTLLQAPQTHIASASAIGGISTERAGGGTTSTENLSQSTRKAFDLISSLSCGGGGGGAPAGASAVPRRVNASTAASPSQSSATASASSIANFISEVAARSRISTPSNADPTAALSSPSSSVIPGVAPPAVGAGVTKPSSCLSVDEMLSRFAFKKK